MKFAEFHAVCDLEIDDRVKIKNKEDIYKIYDIRAVHYVRSNKVEFEFFVTKDNLVGGWVKRSAIEHRIIEPGEGYIENEIN